MSEAIDNNPSRAHLPKVLIVEDDPGLQRQMIWALGDDFTVLAANERVAAMELFAVEAPPLVVLDLGLPPDPNGATEVLATLETIMAKQPSTKVIIASGNEERTNALRAVAFGAHDFFSKPVDFDELRLTLIRAKRFQDLEEENRLLTQMSRSPLEGIISASP